MLAKWRAQGFTLIELMLTLSIVIILTLIAIPSLRSLVQNHRISSVADNLYYFLQNARSEAIKRNAHVYVSFIPGDAWCYGMNVSSACTCSTPGSCSLGAVVSDNPEQISLSMTGLTGNSVYFEGTHAAANARGALTFTLYGQTPLISLSIGRLGNIQLCSTGISGYTAC